MSDETGGIRLVPGMPEPITGGQGSVFSLAFLRSAEQGVKLLTPDGQVTFINDVALAELGLGDQGAVSGLLWWELWPDADEAALREIVARAGAGEALRFHGRRRDGQGALTVWDVTVSPISDSEGKVESLLVVTRPLSQE